MTIPHYKNPSKAYSLSAWTGAFLIIGLIFSLLCFYLPISRASLVLDVSSKASGESQLFFGETPAYEQKNSAWQHISPGANELTFPLRGSYAYLRWDPLYGAGTIELKDAYISILGQRLEIDRLTLTPAHQIARFERIHNATLIVTDAAANDPQINVSLDFDGLRKQRIIVSAFIGFILALFFIISFFFREPIFKKFADADAGIHHILSALRNDSFSFKEIAVLTAIGSLLYIYFISSLSLSIDDEMAAVRRDPAAWVSQGRWFVYLVEKFLFPQSAIPFAPYIFLVISLALSYALILRAHDRRPDWKSYLLYPIFCAYPTWWFISEFYSNIPALAFGALFVSSSIYLSFKNNLFSHSLRNAILKNFLICILLACAIGAYQSLLLLYASLVCGALIVKLQRSEQNSITLAKSTLAILFKNFALVIASFVLYSALNKIAQITLAADSGYLGNFININALLNSPSEVLSGVIAEMQLIYTGNATRYGASIGLSYFIMIIATLSLASKQLGKSVLLLTLWAGVLITPFGLNFASGGLPLPLRTMLGVAYVSWLACLLTASYKRPLAVLIFGLVIAAYEIQLLSANSQYIASSTITQAHDRMLAADIYRRIGELDDTFDRTTPVEVDIYGKKPVNNLYADGWSSTMQGSFFSWDNGNIERMSIFMRIMGYENISTPSADERIALTPNFKEMPIWPAAGSVKKVGERYLVRLSKEPDPVHATYQP
ncbi:glucosyltransferase domain-containing protein [Pseudomonas sp. JDS28PS106]|uniref:glucosyltransferase domain-containing protein n=1 Tax=Pseudomonas sp. JDS28PS106 TaxID=2497235 RepID=UPI002FD74BE4